jgi:hypothetical protein
MSAYLSDGAPQGIALSDEGVVRIGALARDCFGVAGAGIGRQRCVSDGLLALLPRRNFQVLGFDGIRERAGGRCQLTEGSSHADDVCPR